MTSNAVRDLGLALQPCPGGCGREITDGFLSCPACFERLPADVALAALAEQIRPGQAVEAARAWLVEHPAGGGRGI